MFLHDITRGSKLIVFADPKQCQLWSYPRPWFAWDRTQPAETWKKHDETASARHPGSGYLVFPKNSKQLYLIGKHEVHCPMFTWRNYRCYQTLRLISCEHHICYWHYCDCFIQVLLLLVCKCYYCTLTICVIIVSSFALLHSAVLVIHDHSYLLSSLLLYLFVACELRWRSPKDISHWSCLTKLVGWYHWLMNHSTGSKWLHKLMDGRAL